jgi:predicted helicase
LSKNAENRLNIPDVPCTKISLSTLESAPVDWNKLDQGLFGTQARLPQKNLKEHQKLALEASIEHFLHQDRGKLIMACGTAKTFSSLRIAENQTKGKGLVLFLAPSIALIGQTLKEWSADALNPINAICVCSDPQVSKIKNKNPIDEDISGVAELALPATTSVSKIIERLKKAEKFNPDRLNVIFSTYQSIDRVAEALGEMKKTIDLIICNEAHRTTGVTLTDNDESHFVKVHDEAFLKAKKRLYMTATPKIFGDDLKKNSEEVSATLCSMDDENLYGKEIYHLGFGEAVKRDLLSDYKVLVLTVNRNILAANNAEPTDEEKETDADDLTKLIGCRSALSKNMDYQGKFLLDVDPGVMHKAVAFCQTIPKSKAIANVFNRMKGAYPQNKFSQNPENTLVDAAADHIDGTMGAATRYAKMAWLKASPNNPNECRLLTNVRCLGEGIDVPSLDAVLFLSAKDSQIEVVQSVGRVIRKAEGKNFGYILIPVVLASYQDPEKVLKDHERFKVVWMVLNALKVHDDRFVALINKINLNQIKPDGGGAVLIGGIAGKREDNEFGTANLNTADLLKKSRKTEYLFHNALYAKIVIKLGGHNQQDMLQWAADVAKIAEGFQERITTVVNKEGPHKREFDKFLTGLRQTLNPSVDTTEAIEVLAQHLITKPVFEALFEESSFVKNNPVSQSLEAMIDVI